MNKYIFEITYNGNTTEFSPFGSIVLDYEKDDGSLYFEKKLDKFNIIDKSDYNFLKQIEDSGDLCNDILLTVFSFCNGIKVEEFKGKFTITDCEINDNDCTIVINPKPNTSYSCLINKGKKEVNVLEETIEQIIDVDYENNIFIYNALGIENILRVPKGDPPPTADLLTDYVPENEIEFIKIQKLDPDIGLTHNHYVAWQYRKGVPKTEATCKQTLSGGYTFLSSNLTTCFYQKKPADVDRLALERDGGANTPSFPQEIQIYNGVWGDEGVLVYVWYLPYASWLDKDQPHLGYQNGFKNRSRKLEDCLNALISGCGFNGVKSDYFQINPNNPSLINYVTNQATKINNIHLVQKSDAIFWQSSEPASVQNNTFNDFIDGLKNIFNVEWTIENNYLIIEHESFFENASQLIDLTVGKYKTQIEGKKSYSYEKELLPYVEEINQSDYSNEDFEQSEIIYEDTFDNKLNCVGVEKVEYSFGIFFTDVQFYQEVPTDVSLDGWVIVACNTDATPKVHNEIGLKSNASQINGHLAITNLVNNYYLHGRSATLGKIDGNDKIFSSSKKIKNSETFSIIECCDDIITPDNSIKDNIGIGEITELSKDLKTNKLTIKLKY